MNIIMTYNYQIFTTLLILAVWGYAWAHKRGFDELKKQHVGTVAMMLPQPNRHTIKLYLNGVMIMDFTKIRSELLENAHDLISGVLITV